jgi:hypothetical protein
MPVEREGMVPSKQPSCACNDSDFPVKAKQLGRAHTQWATVWLIGF